MVREGEQLRYDGAAVGSREHCYFLIVRCDDEEAEVLVLRFLDGRTVLPVFGREEETGMFLWLETAGEGWCVAEFPEADLATLLHGSCVGVRQIVYPFAANAVGKASKTVDREDFLQTLSVEQNRQTKEAYHQFVPDFVSLSPVGKGDFW